VAPTGCSTGWGALFSTLGNLRPSQHLKFLVMADGEEFEVVEIFPCKKIRNMEIAKFSEFYSQN